MVAKSRALSPVAPSPESPAPAPRVPFALPFVGHLPTLIRHPLRLARLGYAECGDISEFRVPFKRFFLFAGPEAHAFVLNAPETDLSMSEFFKFLLPTFFGPAFKYDAEIDFPYSHTKMFYPLFTETMMKQHARTVATEVEAAVEGLDGDVDLYALAKAALLRTASRCLFGTSLDDAGLASFAGFYGEMSDAMSLKGITAGRLNLPFFRKAETARLKIVGLVREALRRRRDHGASQDSVIEIMAESRHPTGRAFTVDEITGCCMQLIFAAHTPASVAFAWTGVELANDALWRERVIAEIDAHYPWRDAPLAASRAMTSLDWTIQESLRLHPPAAFHARCVKRDLTYKGYELPAGSIALISLDVSHRIPRYFPNPERFDPLRFSPERSEHRAHPLALVTFGAGPRRCIGSAFAMLQLSMLWAALLRRYHLTMLDIVTPKYSGMLMTPSQPCRARLKAR